MKTIPTLFLCTALVILQSGCLVATSNSVSDVPTKELPKEHIVLKTSSPPGQEFSGTLKVDGEAREIHGTSPWELELDCSRLTGKVRKLKGDGDLEFVITRKTGNCSFGTSRSCHFSYSEGGLTVTAP